MCDCSPVFSCENSQTNENIQVMCSAYIDQGLNLTFSNVKISKLLKLALSQKQEIKYEKSLLTIIYVVLGMVFFALSYSVEIYCILYTFLYIVYYAPFLAFILF